jgi:hypothetical protein
MINIELRIELQIGPRGADLNLFLFCGKPNSLALSTKVLP